MAADTLITLAEEPNLHAPPSGAANLWFAFRENRGAVAGAGGASTAGFLTRGSRAPRRKPQRRTVAFPGRSAPQWLPDDPALRSQLRGQPRPAPP